MRGASPLRYPGGKSAMTGLLAQIRKLNGLRNHAVAEPFAGGAGASLSLLYLEETKKIFINDADPAIYDFWWSLVSQPKRFLDYLSNAEITIEEWHLQRDVYKNPDRVSRVRRGFATFFLNRCNHSGIMKAGPIGGMNQNGKWKLDARFNKENLKRRCGKVSEYRNRIDVSPHDGIKFFDKVDGDTTMFFIDPPYFEKGRTLYLDCLEDDYHQVLADRLKAMRDKAWVLTYDDCPEIRAMYENWAYIRSYSLPYAVNSRRRGNEVLIVPKWIRLPDWQASAALRW